MGKVDDGGYAFDKTLLDYFAGQVISGIYSVNDFIYSDDDFRVDEETLAKCAYSQAQAMIAEKRRLEKEE